MLLLLLLLQRHWPPVRPAPRQRHSVARVGLPQRSRWLALDICTSWLFLFGSLQGPQCAVASGSERCGFAHHGMCHMAMQNGSCSAAVLELVG